jgi:Cu/Ag efflux protein CusF
VSGLKLQPGRRAGCTGGITPDPGRIVVNARKARLADAGCQNIQARHSPAGPLASISLVTHYGSPKLSDMTMHSGKRRICGRAAILLLLACAAFGGTPGQKRPIPFSGRVESIDLKLLTVAITHGPIPGFMPAMTMDYPVDSKAALLKLKPADEITATVYVGDPTLHDVHVVKHP